jgi:hypothetical protein
VDSCNTTGGIEVDGVWEEEPVLLEEFGAVEVDGSSVVIGVEVGVASSARSKWRQSRHFWSCGHREVLVRNRPLRIESQLPHATSDAEYMLFACALVGSKCLPLQVLQCGWVLAPVASTGTMKEPRCVAMLLLQLQFKGIFRVGFRC